MSDVKKINEIKKAISRADLVIEKLPSMVGIILSISFLFVCLFLVSLLTSFVYSIFILIGYVFPLAATLSVYNALWVASGLFGFYLHFDREGLRAMLKETKAQILEERTPAFLAIRDLLLLNLEKESK